MIYSTIPQKYLRDELTEIFKDLAKLYLFIPKLEEIRGEISENLLDRNDGEAVIDGQLINVLSTDIKDISHNCQTMTECICKEEKITPYDCGKIMDKFDILIKANSFDELLELPNIIVKNLAKNFCKRYPKYNINQIDKEADGSCPM